MCSIIVIHCFFFFNYFFLVVAVWDGDIPEHAENRESLWRWWQRQASLRFVFHAGMACFYGRCCNYCFFFPLLNWFMCCIVEWHLHFFKKIYFLVCFCQHVSGMLMCGGAVNSEHLVQLVTEVSFLLITWLVYQTCIQTSWHQRINTIHSSWFFTFNSTLGRILWKN